ncbi:anthranilate synthase component II [Fulvivirga lutimaris]|uniref:anthranilate synthase component II n=1 Tax=Fulvivirga lutimaris TaxID=1819566 RepID=UPI0012BC265A|nr:aminodeoxychorismate/anthranilate synthase component II [Fulvivirga lutimaris]MTI38957.1 aminodeoxychorismate/anthranilate synthase component II [Fulvivirga lutimaris]
MKILVLDNYDSFTYNLVHIIKELGYGKHMTIARNDKITLDEVAGFDKILLSPGPGIPEDAGILKSLIMTYAASKSILGVCLGHQAIAEVFDAELFNIKEVKHGMSGPINVLDQTNYIFEGVSATFTGAHYHSWAVKRDSIGAPLTITAEDDHGLVMGLKHEQFDVQGLQFHPESIMTEHGKMMIKNWIEK